MATQARVVIRKTLYACALLLACLAAVTDALPRGSSSIPSHQHQRELQPKLPSLDDKKKKSPEQQVVPENSFTAQDHSSSDDSKKDKKNKKNKSAAPSVVPTASPAPTISAPPSPQPSVPPTPAPTPQPSAEPTHPTAQPSANPTDQPTVPPTPPPTVLPTDKPNTLPRNVPIMDPTDPPIERTAVTTTTRNAKGDILVMDSHCSGDLPAAASEVTEQLVNFQYKLYLLPDVSPEIAISFLERRLHRNMTASLLDCAYDDDSPLEWNGFNSDPADTVLGVCPEGGYDGAVCYNIQAGMTVRLFYMAGRKLQVLQDEILDTRIVEMLGPFMDSLYASNSLAGPYDEFVGMDFDGFTNIYTGDATYDGSGTDEDDSGVAGIKGDGQKSINDGSKVPVAMASMAVAIAAIVLAVVVVLGIRRRREEKQSTKRDLSIDTDPVSPNRYDQKYTYDDEMDQEEPSALSKKYPLVAHEARSVEEDSIFVDSQGHPYSSRYEEEPPSRYSYEESLSQVTGDRSYEVDDTVNL